MQVTITNALPPINESDLVKYEQEINARFPTDFREFLVKHNGGIPNPSAFTVDMKGFKNRTRLRRLLGIGDENEESFKNFMRVYRHRIPTDFLPIGLEISGGLVCIAIRDVNYGNVYFWDHNWEAEEEPDYSNVYLLADSFSSFLDQLHKD